MYWQVSMKMIPKSHLSKNEDINMTNAKNFKILNEINKLWRSETGERISLRTISVFLHVAMYPGSSSEAIQKATGLSQSAVSRHTMSLSKINRSKKPGYDLIDEKSDPMNRRRKLYTLTRKGEKFLQKLKAAHHEEKTIKLVAYSRDKIFEVNNFIEGVKVIGQDEFWETIQRDELKAVIAAEVDSHMYDAIKAKGAGDPIFITNTPIEKVIGTKTKGIRRRGKKWAIDKLYKGIRLTGSYDTLEEAEQTLKMQIAKINGRKQKYPKSK